MARDIEGSNLASGERARAQRLRYMLARNTRARARVANGYLSGLLSVRAEAIELYSCPYQTDRAVIVDNRGYKPEVLYNR